MKRYFDIFTVAFLGILVSCNKGNFDIARDKYLEIEGRYDCISAVWLGIPVDLNNDGESSCNINDEFKGLSNSLSALEDNVMTITAIDKSGHTGCMAIRFPMQYIREHNSDKRLSFANPLGNNACNLL